MAKTLAVVSVPDFKSESSRYDTKYKRTAKWDPVKGDFVRDGANRIVSCTGEEGFMIWCFKVAQTERYSCLAYAKSIGVEMEAALAADNQKVVESMVQRTITDALKVNPRTEYVTNFEFTWDTDSMHSSIIPSMVPALCPLVKDLYFFMISCCF